MRWLWRYWPWLPPSRDEVLATALGVAILAALLVAMVKFPYFGHSSNLGFGPDWDCAYTPNSESVCVKRVPVQPPQRTAPVD